MNDKRRDPRLIAEGKHPAFWQGSTYEEPTWVSLAWIIGPVLVASAAIYAVLSQAA